MIHRGFGSGLDQDLDRVGGERHGLLDRFFHPTEHVVGYGHANRWSPDTDANPDEIITKMLNDRPETVVATRPAADLYPHCPCREVQVVVQDDELFGFIPSERCTRVVHVRRRLEERDLPELEAYRSGLGLFLRAPGATVTPREFVDDEKADVVAGALVGAAWVSKAHDDG